MGIIHILRVFKKVLGNNYIMKNLLVVLSVLLLAVAWMQTAAEAYGCSTKTSCDGHKDGDIWLTGWCDECSCVVTKTLRKKCLAKKGDFSTTEQLMDAHLMSLFDNHNVLTEEDGYREYHCREYAEGESVAADEEIVTFSTVSERAYCCQRVLRNWQVDPGCSVVLDFDECTANFVNVQTGEPCESQGSVEFGANSSGHVTR